MIRAEIAFVSGPFAGRKFAIPESGFRIGRANGNDACVPDEGLSRNHCFIEWREKTGYTLTDCASANGTYLNGEDIGSSARPIAFGDVVEIGESAFEFVNPENLRSEAATGPIDLGLEKPKQNGQTTTADARQSENRRASGALTHVALVVAALLAAGSIAFLLMPRSAETLIDPDSTAKGTAHRVSAFSYEKVEADCSRICRLEITMNREGELSLTLDDVPGENRHIDKSSTLKRESRERIDELLASKRFVSLEPSYAGQSAGEINSLTSFRIRAIIDGKPSETLVENTTEPEDFKSVRDAIEALAVNELGLWALRYTREQLIEKSAESEKLADVKWEERDVDYGNLAAAIKSYREAIVTLETVNPKPPSFDGLLEKLRVAEEELGERYADQSFRADQAIKIGDFETARNELRLIIDLIVDKSDDRYAKAAAKLVDVESRLKKGGSRK